MASLRRTVKRMKRSQDFIEPKGENEAEEPLDTTPAEQNHASADQNAPDAFDIIQQLINDGSMLTREQIAELSLDGLLGPQPDKVHDCPVETEMIETLSEVELSLLVSAIVDQILDTLASMDILPEQRDDMDPSMHRYNRSDLVVDPRADQAVGSDMRNAGCGTLYQSGGVSDDGYAQYVDFWPQDIRVADTTSDTIELSFLSDSECLEVSTAGDIVPLAPPSHTTLPQGQDDMVPLLYS
ncbi:hypothetical protein Micbo1qcDRAFT_202432 [Microdochium bolleyi]|uniref:Uncharacterized protein n=1 Tax=Microdochium bolleyi TaxID=196109 RepID=A0A136JBR3_9PEZI|nr:hypothetical protein Micbo1qcDRAFT_202432 [Microdochium bolleyi]